MSRFLFIGAHPDDPDILFSGTAIQLVRKGHAVKFVAAVNGDAGRQSMRREALAKRRRAEADNAAKLIGLEEYQILNHHDCELECNLENRAEMVRLIRRFCPDVVISHWTGDYHADHRACGQLVMDAAYLLGVPLYCSDTPVPEVNPVFAYAYHGFTDPRPIRADAAVEIDSVIEAKLRALDCHRSQFYEWLPYEAGLGVLDPSQLSWPERKKHLLRWVERFRDGANKGRKLLERVYGSQGKTVAYAEIFEQSRYGRQVSDGEFQNLFTA